MAKLARSETRTTFSTREERLAPPRTSVSATVLPFMRPPPCTFCITQAKRARSAAWATQRAFSLSRAWWVETHLTDDGATWLGVVMPLSRRCGGEFSLAWLIERTGRGVELTRSMTWKAEVFHDVNAVLALIETVERMLCTAA